MEGCDYEFLREILPSTFYQNIRCAVFFAVLFEAKLMEWKPSGCLAHHYNEGVDIWKPNFMYFY